MNRLKENAALVSIGAAVVSGFFAWMTYNLQGEIKDIQFRPYVGVEEVRWGSTQNDDGSTRIQVIATIINTGLVPAKNIRIDMSASADGVSIPTSNPDSTGILMGGGSRTAKGWIIDVPAESFSLLQKGDVEWKIYVKIDYDGLFSKGYPYEQEFRYDPLVKQFGSKGGDAF